MAIARLTSVDTSIQSDSRTTPAIGSTAQAVAQTRARRSAKLTTDIESFGVRMARDGAAYVCQSCGAVQTRWSGQCPACGAWNSLVEEVSSRPPGAMKP